MKAKTEVTIRLERNGAALVPLVAHRDGQYYHQSECEWCDYEGHTQLNISGFLCRREVSKFFPGTADAELVELVIAEEKLAGAIKCKLVSGRGVEILGHGRSLPSLRLLPSSFVQRCLSRGIERYRPYWVLIRRVDA